MFKINFILILNIILSFNISFAWDRLERQYPESARELRQQINPDNLNRDDLFNESLITLFQVHKLPKEKSERYYAERAWETGQLLLDGNSWKDALPCLAYARKFYYATALRSLREIYNNKYKYFPEEIRKKIYDSYPQPSDPKAPNLFGTQDQALALYKVYHEIWQMCVDTYPKKPIFFSFRHSYKSQLRKGKAIVSSSSEVPKRKTKSYNSGAEYILLIEEKKIS